VTRLTLNGHFRDKKLIGDPDAAESPFRLQAMKAAPSTRTVTLAPGKYAREMALVNEAAKQGNIGEFAARVLSEFFGALDAHFGQPLVGRSTRRLFKRPRKVTARQSALMRDLCDRKIVCQIDIDKVTGALQLPR
jgi:hypothetical protein